MPTEFDVERHPAEAYGFVTPPTDLLYDDGAILETPQHRANMNVLIELTEVRLNGRKDFYTGGNMFLYFSAEQARNRDFKGPDYFFVDGADHDRERLYWAVWDEDGRYPTVIVELTSPSTAKVDRGAKKKLYERTFKTPEYFLYDPILGDFEGWRLADGKYRKIEPDARGWLWCESLQVWLGPWHGVYLNVPGTYVRFYDADGNLVPLFAERAAAQADAAQAQADAAQAQADAERRRADSAEAENERLRREIAALRGQAAEGGAP
ncbi:MAG: Uma2 family endonuclease [Gemmataceae bacterium]